MTKKFHETQHVSTKDRYFVTGLNPSSDGGGIIATANHLPVAQEIQREAIKKGYTRVRVSTHKEFFSDDFWED